jgi:nicotinamidase/pyrazinamidase
MNDQAQSLELAKEELNALPLSRRKEVKSILFVVDVQNDVFTGGPFDTEMGINVPPDIIAGINGLMGSGCFDYIIAIQEWHPAGHVSFASTHGVAPGTAVTVTTPDYTFEQVAWPDHGVQNSAGAEFFDGRFIPNNTAPAVDSAKFNIVFRKGSNPDTDAYSIFGDNPITYNNGEIKKNMTGLHHFVNDIIDKNRDVRFNFCGTCTDGGIKFSVMDLLNLIQDYIATQAKKKTFSIWIHGEKCAGSSPANHAQALQEMEAMGCKIII